MTDWHLAQLNIAHALEPLESPRLADFVGNLDRINALAEASPGFVWRLQDEDGNATAIRPFGEDVILNLSVWEDVESLHHFVYRTAHAEILGRRAEWFERMRTYAALWWIPAGTVPSVDEAKLRLERLEAAGPSEYAFSFGKRFAAPNTRATNQ